MSESFSGIWFVYDGECPICQYAAHALKIREQYGEMHLLDARSELAHPLLQEINTRGMDLDEGMIIFHEGTFYHGKSALWFMAQFSEDRGIFNWFNKAFFWSDKLATLMYPWMRAVRNGLLKIRGKKKIDNLKLSRNSIFQPIFAEQWQTLPFVIKKHYANRPYTQDKVVVEGILDVQSTGFINFLKPFYRLLGGIPIVSEKNVPVTVSFDSDPNTRAFHFNREFHFKEHKPYRFASRMLQLEGNRVVEIMRFGICWLMTYEWSQNRVWLRHQGYAWKFLGHYIPLPLHWLIGKGDAEEVAVDEDHFDMKVTISHPWFGEMYFYCGRFKVIKTL